jgi:HEAT repeat protein
MSRFLPFLFVVAFVTTLHAQEGDDKKKKGPPEGLKALQHPDAAVRYRAAETLAQLGPTAKFALPELRETLKDKNGVVRVKAAEAIWKIEQPAPSTLMPVLLAALRDKDFGVRAAAPPVIALFGAKAKPAVPALAEALKDKEVSVKLSAIAALGDIGPAAKETAGDLLDLTSDKEFFLLEPFVGAALANMGDGVVPTLGEALAHKLGERRRVAAYALGSIGPGAAPAANALAKALMHEDLATRQLAVRALGKIGPKAKSTLVQIENATSDKDAAIRIEAALAAWLISGEAKHVGVLVKDLGDESPNVRDNACQSLAQMKAAAKDAVDPVAKLLDDKDLRIRAIITLGEIGKPAEAHAPRLTKLLEDKDGEAKLWSAFALWQITGETKMTIKVLEEMLGSELHDKQAITLLGDMKSAAKDALPTLITIYREDDDASFRQAVGVAIKKIDPEAAMKLGIR